VSTSRRAATLVRQIRTARDCGFDAFLLVVDGIPSGGAFNPALTTLDLTNVGASKCCAVRHRSYGATSFVGVIQIIHYAAGARRRGAGEPGFITAASRRSTATCRTGACSASLSANVKRTITAG
jgi:hypothetical protein